MAQNTKQQPKSPVMPTNLGKINIGNNQQPKVGQSSERNMFGNNNNYQPQPQQDTMMGRQANSGQINGPKALFDSRMDIEGIGMTSSQVMNRQNNNFTGNHPNNNYQNYSSVNTGSQQFHHQQQQQNFRQDNYQQQLQQQQVQQNQFQNRLQSQQFQQQQGTISSSRQTPV